MHRDLKPQNLMLKRDPESGNIILKIADFGFARVLKDHDLSRTHVGSPVYMVRSCMWAREIDMCSGVFAHPSLKSDLS